MIGAGHVERHVVEIGGPDAQRIGGEAPAGGAAQGQRAPLHQPGCPGQFGNPGQRDDQRGAGTQSGVILMNGAGMNR